MQEQPPSRDDGLLTSTEAAKLLGVHPRTLLRWAEAEKIPSTRTFGGVTGGGHRRFKVEDIEAAAAQMRRQTSAG